MYAGFKIFFSENTGNRYLLYLFIYLELLGGQSIIRYIADGTHLKWSRCLQLPAVEIGDYNHRAESTHLSSRFHGHHQLGRVHVQIKLF